MVAAEWPTAGLIPLGGGVENVTPRLTKSLALKKQLSTHPQIPSPNPTLEHS